MATLGYKLKKLRQAREVSMRALSVHLKKQGAKARARDAIIANSGEFLFPSSTIKEPTEGQINEYILKNEPKLYK